MGNNKLKNSEKIYDLLNEAINYLIRIEYEWEEDILTDNQTDSILDIKEQLQDILDQIQEQIHHLKKGDSEIRN